MWLGLLACERDNPPAPPPRWHEIADACADQWPDDGCLGGCPDPTDQRWAEGYRDHVADAWGFSRAKADRSLEVRSVQGSVLHLQLESDWVVAQFFVLLPAGDPPGSEEEAAQRLASAPLPRFDPRLRPRPWDDASAELAAAEDAQGVTFPDPWCVSAVQMGPGDPTEAVTFDFFVPKDDGECAVAAIGAFNDFGTSSTGGCLTL